MKKYVLIKDHGIYKKGEEIVLHPSTAECFMQQGYIANPAKKKVKKEQ